MRPRQRVAADGRVDSTRAAAEEALEAWDGRGEPTGWHRHPATGRRVDKDGNAFVAM